MACGGRARDETLIAPAEGAPRASAERGSPGRRAGSRSDSLPALPTSAPRTSPADAAEPSPGSASEALPDDQPPTDLQDDGLDASAACESGQTRCNGAELQRCRADGTAFETIQYCASAALCTLGGGSCANGCTPGEVLCSGLTLMRCNDDRTAYETVEQCAAGCDHNGCIPADGGGAAAR